MKKKKSKKKIIIGAAAVLVVAGGVTVAGQRNSKETQIPQVPVVTAEMGDVEEIVDATGTVGSTRHPGALQGQNPLLLRK